MFLTLKKILHFFIPPPGWRIPVVLLLGAFVGVGLYILIVSNSTAYLSDDPKACVNCHVMYPQYATWQHSSHARVASCVDCHVPHDNYLHKYSFKAQDGLRHATIFTLRQEPQVIRIKEAGKQAVQANCLRCHESLFGETNATMFSPHADRQRVCWECHRETPHGSVRSLSSLPDARVPQLPRVMPDWMEHFLTDSKKQRGAHENN